MMFRALNGRFFASLALCGFMLAAAGCQSGSKDVLDVGKQDTPPPPSDKILASQLRAYCPAVSLRAGTAYFSTYARGGQDDASKLIYQASITDVTRDCSHENGTLGMKVAVAGKVVPGPLGKAGTITMPIRVVVTHGADVLYSKLHQYKIQIADTSAATQFVFTDADINVPEPTARDYQVFAGYDEGPSRTSKADDAKPVRKKVRKPKKVAEPAAPSAPAATSLSDIPR